MYEVKKLALLLFILMGLFLVFGWTFLPWTTSEKERTTPSPNVEQTVSKYGFDLSQYHLEDYAIKPNAFMADILMSHDVDFQTILSIERAAEEVFSLRKIKSGKKITLIKDDPCGAPIAFVYKPAQIDYFKYEFGDEVCVSADALSFEVCRETAAGTVTSSLWNAMVGQGFDFNLIDKMEDAVSQVNFYTAQVGDQFKLVYDRIYIEGKPVSTGRIHSAAYQSSGIIDYGFYFENDKYAGYYDLEGVPNKRTFLKAPVRFSRVSSSYNPNRFHPVLKRRKPHLGTDYAAQRGTPIFAVADGVITRRSFTRGNGNYVKIKHDKTYQTQYLHMSKFASGLRVGSAVKQGQTIGFVGSTGLATGPHVCFRFWKNGRQINHTRENFPPLNPMAESDLPVFYQVRDALFSELEEVQIQLLDSFSLAL